MTIADVVLEGGADFFTALKFVVYNAFDKSFILLMFVRFFSLFLRIRGMSCEVRLPCTFYDRNLSDIKNFTHTIMHTMHQAEHIHVHTVASSKRSCTIRKHMKKLTTGKPALHSSAHSESCCSDITRSEKKEKVATSTPLKIVLIFVDS